MQLHAWNLKRQRLLTRTNIAQQHLSDAVEVTATEYEPSGVRFQWRNSYAIARVEANTRARKAYKLCRSALEC